MNVDSSSLPLQDVNGLYVLSLELQYRAKASYQSRLVSLDGFTVETAAQVYQKNSP